MNIDTTNASSTPRVALPEFAATEVRQQGVQAKAPEAARTSQAIENTDKKAPDKLEVKRAVEKISDFISSRQSELNFSIDDASGSQIVKIMDTQTKQVIRQFPSEEAVAIAHALDKLQGLLIKDKA
ncbi:MAG: flagellar protein FlaG [Pseudomonadota bacterium]